MAPPRVPSLPFPRLGCAALGAALLGVFACGEPPPVDPKGPSEALVSEGDYRFSTLHLAPVDQGLDVDGDGTEDNHFPYLLDALYASVEEAVVPLLEMALNSATEAQQAWAVISAALTAAGIPINAAAYDQTISEGASTAELNVVVRLASSGSDFGADLFKGGTSPSGYTLLEPLARFTGTGLPTTTNNPAVSFGTGDYLALYPEELFILTVSIARSVAVWTEGALNDGSLSGAISLSNLITVVLGAIPETIVINGETIEIPLEELEVALAASLLALQTADGSSMFDIPLPETGEPAVSTGFLYLGTPVTVLAQEQ